MMSYMTTHLDRLDLRHERRIPVESLCTEVTSGREQLSLVVELAERGLRLQRPLNGRLHSRIVQLEFEVPEVDEVVWAKGLICFDQLWRGHERHGRGLLVRTSGVRVLAAATRHLRMLQDYVVATSERQRRVGQPRWSQPLSERLRMLPF
jgi:hypothetical protein